MIARKDLRYGLPIRLWFNILKSRHNYIRGASVIPAALEGSGQGPGLVGRDDLEQFLLRMEAKIDFILTLMADNLVRKEYTHKAAVMDVSESGAKVISPIELKKGTTLEIGIYIPANPIALWIWPEKWSGSMSRTAAARKTGGYWVLNSSISASRIRIR